MSNDLLSVLSRYWPQVFANLLMREQDLPAKPLQSTPPQPGYEPEMSDEEWAREQEEMEHLRSLGALAPRGLPWRRWRKSENVEDFRAAPPTIDPTQGRRMLLDGSIIDASGRAWRPSQNLLLDRSASGTSN